MREITNTDEFKKIQLGILNCVDIFCKKNNIKYSLGYGTLIGAVRHKGFIPWDDDIDIVMKRDDYDRFIMLFSKERGRYKVWAHSLQKGYPFAYAKVTDEQTLKIESVNHDIERGLDIDLFPIDDLPDDIFVIRNQFNKFRTLHGILTLKQITYSPTRPLYKNLIAAIGRLLFCWYPLHKIVADLEANAIKYRGCSGSKCAQMVAYIYKEKEISPRYYTESFIELDFEGKKYPVMCGYDSYLRQIYGDYMKLPPVDKQITHHGFKVYWKD